MKHGVRWSLVLIVAAVLGFAAAANSGEPSAKAPAKTMVGEIQEHQPMMAGMDPGFKAMFNGIQFVLKENTNLLFRFYTDTFDEAVKEGFMAKAEGGMNTFLDLKGKKVEVTYTPAATNVLKVMAVKWLDDKK